MSIDTINRLLESYIAEMAYDEIDMAAENIENHLDDTIYGIAREALEFWRNEAGRTLNTTRLRYQSALYIYEDFSEGTVISLTTQNDSLLDAIENGATGFDMKPGLLKGAVRRVIPIGDKPDFRTVSTSQGSDKWMHPGWEGINLKDVTDDYIDDVLIPKHLEKLLEKL